MRDLQQRLPCYGFYRLWQTVQHSHPALFQSTQYLAPTLRRLAHTVLDDQESLLALRSDAGHQQRTQLFGVRSESAVNTVRSSKDPTVLLQSRIVPDSQLPRPHLLERRHRARRKALSIWTRQDFEGRCNLAPQHALQIQSRYRSL